MAWRVKPNSGLACCLFMAITMAMPVSSLAEWTAAVRYGTEVSVNGKLNKQKVAANFGSPIALRLNYTVPFDRDSGSRSDYGVYLQLLNVPLKNTSDRAYTVASLGGVANFVAPLKGSVDHSLSLGGTVIGLADFSLENNNQNTSVAEAFIEYGVKSREHFSFGLGLLVQGFYTYSDETVLSASNLYAISKWTF